jgi:hypothetical protein
MQISLLILSCDKYKSFWELSTLRINKYWPNFPGKKFLLTNHLKPSYFGFELISIGKDKDWTTNLISAINVIREEYILFMLEDAVINSYVDEDSFRKICHNIALNNLSYVNLKASPKPKGNKYIDNLREIPPGTHYRVSIANSIWKKEVLHSLLIPGESAWEFERSGSLRSNIIGGFYGLSSPLFKIQHCVVKGKFLPSIYRQLVSSDELPIDTLPSMSLISEFYLNVKIFRSKFFTFIIPSKYQQSLRNFFD